ncbi:hypothetical protein IWZ01DRAFT_483477 [Phyllosticta capitalensis]
MDHCLKSTLLPEKPVPHQRIRILESLRDHAQERIYRFEVTYGLYVMDFWEKMVVYAFIAIILGFAMWQAIIPLSIAFYRALSRQLILEPKNFYSSIEPASRAYSTVFLSSVIGSSNISTTALLW